MEKIRALSELELKDRLLKGLESEGLLGRRVLAIIPDSTRTAPIPLAFRTLAEAFRKQGGRLDFLLALGTHPPMTEAEIEAHLKLPASERKRLFPDTEVFNHHWKDPQVLAEIGRIEAGEMASLTGGLYTEAVPVQINRRVFDYDRLLIIGPVFPHEVIGFSGGNKYLFPGISGAEIINAFHWLGALITNPNILGTADPPVKTVVNRATAFLDRPVSLFAFVMSGHDAVGLFTGGVDDAWRAAVELSRRVNIVYKPRPFRTIFSHMPAMYHDIWLAGKGMYKVEPVAADGGEVIIYAPHIKTVSHTHGEVLERIGYHTRDYFLAQAEKFADVPGGIRAHSTHVKGIGRYVDGIEKPRVTVTLATSIPESVCRRINLNYRDPASLNPEDFKNREEEGILYVARAGEVLYRLEDGSVPDIDRL